MDELEIKRERNFLHDIINKSTVAQGRIKLSLLKLQADKPLSQEQIIGNLEKCLNAVDEIITITNKHRNIIVEEESFIPDPEINFDEEED